MDQAPRRSLLARYAEGATTAMEVRRSFDGATYGDVLRMLADEGPTLPRAPVEGREETLARARDRLFPKDRHG